MRITSRLEMLGDQRSVLINRCRITGFDGGSETPVQFGTI